MSESPEHGISTRVVGMRHRKTMTLSRKFLMRLSQATSKMEAPSGGKLRSLACTSSPSSAAAAALRRSSAHGLRVSLFAPCLLVQAAQPESPAPPLSGDAQSTGRRSPRVARVEAAWPRARLSASVASTGAGHAQPRVSRAALALTWPLAPTSQRLWLAAVGYKKSGIFLFSV